MLRYFYLICLLVCIRWSFCYDYISEENNYRPLRKLRKDTRFRQRRQRIEDRSGSKRQEYEDPVAHIDVASFIQKPDYDAVEENNAYDNRQTNRRHVSKDYGDYGSLSRHGLEYINQGKGKDHPTLNTGNSVSFNIRPEFENPEIKNYKDKYSAEQSMVHKQKKKCSLRQMSFPFFSHKKTATLKPKKNKRKLFSLNKNCQKVGEPNINDNDKHQYNFYKVKKRSYEERICPLCNSKFIVNNNNGLPLNSKMYSSKLIHNGKQFFQDINNAHKDKTKYDTSDFNDAMNNDLSEAEKPEVDNINIDYREDRRRKREDERERQLKELEEVQRKVDGVEIQSPSPSKGRFDVNIS